MNASEQLMERVKALDEEQAKCVLEILERVATIPAAQLPQAKGARAMRGYAKKYNHDLKTTEEWMKELRGGEDEA